MQRASPCRGQRHAEGHARAVVLRLAMVAVASKTSVAIERGACQFKRISVLRQLSNRKGVHARGKDTLFDALDVVDDWAVCNHLCAFVDTNIVGHTCRPRLTARRMVRCMNPASSHTASLSFKLHSAGLRMAYSMAFYAASWLAPTMGIEAVL